MNILVSAYACNPYGVSEAYSGFRWIEALSRKYNVTVVTPDWWVEKINRYYAEKGEDIPFEIIPIAVNQNVFQRSMFINYVIKAKYFFFNYYAYKKLKELGRNFDFILHRNPVGIRYPNMLYKLDSKLIIGPLSGGLNIPKEIKSIRKKDKISVVLRKLDTLWFAINPYLKRTYSNAEKILISGDYLRDLIPKAYKGKLVNIFETGIDTSAFEVNSDTSNNNVRLLFVGRLVNYKGLDLLLNALARIDRQKFNFVLDVLGDGPSKKESMKLSERLGLNTNVVFHGSVPYSEVRKYFNNCDIFCFPSLKEAAGNVFLEAMASGKPTICANVGGPKEILDSECAVLIDIKSEEQFINDLGSKLEVLLSDKDLRRSLGQRARERVETKYDWKVIEQNIFSFFDAL